MSGYRRLAAQRRNRYAAGGAARPFSSATEPEVEPVMGEDAAPEGARARSRADRKGKGSGKTQVNVIIAPQGGAPALPPGAVPPGPMPGPPILPPPPAIPPELAAAVAAGGGGPPGMMNRGGRVGFKRGGKVKAC